MTPPTGRALHRLRALLRLLIGMTLVLLPVALHNDHDLLVLWFAAALGLLAYALGRYNPDPPGAAGRHTSVPGRTRP